MSFLDLGMGEILLVIVVALVIWGPDKLPEIVRKVGKVVNTLKKASSDLTAEIRKELEKEEIETQSQPNINGSIKAGESPEIDTPEASDTKQAKPEGQ